MLYKLLILIRNAVFAVVHYFHLIGKELCRLSELGWGKYEKDYTYIWFGFFNLPIFSSINQIALTGSK